MVDNLTGRGTVGRHVTTTSLCPTTSATELRAIATCAATVASRTEAVATEGGNARLDDDVEPRAITYEVAAASLAQSRLVRDLHDGAQSQFVAAAINAKRAQQAWSSDPAAAKRMLDACVAQTSDGLRMLRELLAGAQPSILSRLGLRAAVERLAQTLPVRVRVDVSPAQLPEALEASLYFFISEALINIVKHAHAAEAAVTVTVAADEVTAEVRDDGIGGVGLAGMGRALTGLSDRVTALHGELVIQSRRGQGTRLVARIPLPSRDRECM